MGLLEKAIRSLLITPETLGQAGERQIAAKLGWNKLWGYKGRLLSNVYIPRQNGETSEIDLLYITQKGIFVVESKNYAGFIFGNEDNAKWTVTLYAGKDWLGRKRVEKHQFYNPIWQNRTHIKFLKQFLSESIQAFSIISFSQRCSLKDVSAYSPNVFVCRTDSLSKTIRSIWSTYPDTLTEKQIDVIFEKLLPLTNPNHETKQKHIETIRNQLNSTDTCPRCGGKLVIRTAKNGPNAGNQFFGCSNYPKCKYTKPL